MPELSDAVAECVEPKEVDYKDAYACDLTALLRVGYALRSVAQDELERWMKGRSCLASRETHPCPSDVRLAGQPSIGSTKEYPVSAPSGDQYSFVVSPFAKDWALNNGVRIKYAAHYANGKNPRVGELISQKDHGVLYLLPLLARLPVENISFDSVCDFLDRHNGFEITRRNFELAEFQDSYDYEWVQENKNPLMVRNKHGRMIVSPAFQRFVKVKDSLDVYVSVRQIAAPKYRGVELSLEIAVPPKPAR